MDDTPNDPIEALVFECLERFAVEGDAALADLCARFPVHAAALRARITRLRRSGLLAATGDGRDFPERLGEFTLVRRLGGGGMGVVFLARQARPERLVALKVVRPEQLYFAGRRERFAREADAVARLDHPGIVPIHQFGEQDGVPYLVMPWIEGCTLAEVLTALRGRAPAQLTGADLGRVLTDRLGAAGAAAAQAPLYQGGWVAVCLRIAREVALALGHAHGFGIVHGDLRPEGVVVTPDGFKVRGLGVGTALPRASFLAALAGRQESSRVPPELLAGRLCDTRGDVYAFAANPRPADIRLLVEVSDTTLRHDRTVKARL